MLISLIILKIFLQLFGSERKKGDTMCGLLLEDKLLRLIFNHIYIPGI